MLFCLFFRLLNDDFGVDSGVNLEMICCALNLE